MCNLVKYAMFLEGVVENEVVAIVRNSKNKTSNDCFGIDVTILKSIISHVSKPFAYICNTCFSEETFPEQMKTAEVIPLFKSRDTNYRPVSLLPQFSKVLEKLFYNN